MDTLEKMEHMLHLIIEAIQIQPKGITTALTETEILTQVLMAQRNVVSTITAIEFQSISIAKKIAITREAIPVTAPP